MLRNHPFQITRICLGVFIAFTMFALWGISFPIPGMASSNLTLILFGVAAIVFSIGFFPRSLALVLFVGWTFLCTAPHLQQLPHDRYLGWLIFAFVLIPPEGTRPVILTKGAWLITGVSYLASGISKLSSPSWIEGSAVYHIASKDLGNFGFPESPAFLSPLLSWTFLAWEFVQLPLIFFPRGRQIIFISTLIVHASVAIVLKVPSINIGMLVWAVFLAEGSPEIRDLFPLRKPLPKPQ